MDQWKANAQSEFDSWSKNYDRSILQRLFFRPSHDRLLEMASLPEHGQVLDVGCGTGLFASRLLREKNTATVTGLDLSDQMLCKAADNTASFGARARLVHGDSENLPFENNSFDLVTCIHSFHHYPNQNRVVQEMFRVLKPQGQLVLIDGDRDRWWGWLVFDWVVATLEGTVHHCSAARFRDLLSHAGFSGIAQIPSGRVAPFLVNVATATKQEASLPMVA